MATFELAMFLLDKGANPNAADNFYNTHAAVRGNPKRATWITPKTLRHRSRMQKIR